MSTYGVMDLTADSPTSVTAEFWQSSQRSVKLDELRRQLEEIRDAILPVAADQPADSGFGLQTLEFDLTIGAEGKVLFVAKGSIEASIKLTFARRA